MINSSHIEDNDGVELCLMSASVTEQADSRFSDPVTHMTHTHVCVQSLPRSYIKHDNYSEISVKHVLDNPQAYI